MTVHPPCLTWAAWRAADAPAMGSVAVEAVDGDVPSFSGYPLVNNGLVMG